MSKAPKYLSPEAISLAAGVAALAVAAACTTSSKLEMRAVASSLGEAPSEEMVALAADPANAPVDIEEDCDPEAEEESTGSGEGFELLSRPPDDPPPPPPPPMCTGGTSSRCRNKPHGFPCWDREGRSGRCDWINMVSKSCECNAVSFPRTLPDGGPYVPNVPEAGAGPAELEQLFPIVHYEEGRGFTCRGLALDETHHFVFDAETRLPCDEAPKVVPAAERRGPRNSALRAKLSAGKLATMSRIPPEDTTDVPIAPEGPGNPNPPADPGVPDVPGVDCGPPPRSNRSETKYGMPDIIGLDKINAGWTWPDNPAPGLSLGYRVMADGESTIATDPNVCLERDWNNWANGRLSISSGTFQGWGSFNYQNLGSRCSTLACGDNGRWACAQPRGESSDMTLDAEAGIGIQIPLDTLPYARVICHDFKLASVACQIDLGISVQLDYRLQNASGTSECGAQCADGRDTLLKDERLTLGVEGALEIEFSASAFNVGGSGRIGFGVEYEGWDGTRHGTTCAGPVHEQDKCTRIRARIYANGCVGHAYANYCFDYTRTAYLSTTGRCEPFGADDHGDSPGVAAGKACRQKAREFWTWDSYYAQCINCCNAIPIGHQVAPGLIFGVEDDALCKEQCRGLE